jgi:3D (Asp-Asp-Asp) domain-containing protein
VRPNVAGIVATTLFWCATGEPRERGRPTQYRFEATAFSLAGVAKDGRRTEAGMVAADPRILPLGTRVQITGAGRYSGAYVVADTGAKVAGKQLDIYVPNSASAKRFGRRVVHVRVLKWGDGLGAR